MSYPNYSRASAASLARSINASIDRAVAFARTLARDRHINRNIDLAHVLDLTRDIVLSIDRVQDLVPYLDRSHRFDRAFDRDLAVITNRVAALRRDLARDLEGGDDVLDRALDRAHDLGGELVPVLQRLQRDVVALVNTVPSGPEPNTSADSGSRPAAMARWTTGWAVRILPAVQRARWQQEYASELAELIAQGATRRQQLDYGLQVLFNAFSLRRAVGRPVAQRAKDG